MPEERVLGLILRPAEMLDPRYESSTRPRFEVALRDEVEGSVHSCIKFSATDEEDALRIVASRLGVALRRGV